MKKKLKDVDPQKLFYDNATYDKHYKSVNQIKNHDLSLPSPAKYLYTLSESHENIPSQLNTNEYLIFIKFYLRFKIFNPFNQKSF